MYFFMHSLPAAITGRPSFFARVRIIEHRITSRVSEIGVDYECGRGGPGWFGGGRVEFDDNCARPGDFSMPANVGDCRTRDIYTVVVTNHYYYYYYYSISESKMCVFDIGKRRRRRHPLLRITIHLVMPRANLCSIRGAARADLRCVLPLVPVCVVCTLRYIILRGKVVLKTAGKKKKNYYEKPGFSP